MNPNGYIDHMMRNGHGAQSFNKSDQTSSTCRLNLSATTDSAASSNKPANSHRVRDFIHRNKIRISILSVIFIASVASVILVCVNLNHTNDISSKYHKVREKFSIEKCSLNYSIGSEEKSEKSPWLVRIAYDNGTMIFYGCTGYIISDDVILTAAHCVLGEIFELHIGGTAKNNYKDVIKISGKDIFRFPHPDFEFYNYENVADIGLIRLKKPLKFSNVFHPICLPLDEPELPRNFTMAQWTNNDIGNMNFTEKMAILEDSEQCYKMYKNKVDDIELKFYTKGTKNRIIFCINCEDYIPPGNSGTPVVVASGNISIAYGILSFGGTNESPLPNVIVDIRGKLDWIFKHLEVSLW